MKAISKTSTHVVVDTAGRFLGQHKTQAAAEKYAARLAAMWARMSPNNPTQPRVLAVSEFCRGAKQ